MLKKFPGGLVVKNPGVVTAVSLFTAVAWVQSLVWEHSTCYGHGGKKRKGFIKVTYFVRKGRSGTPGNVCAPPPLRGGTSNFLTGQIRLQ